jgi:hypothetical protein
MSSLPDFATALARETVSAIRRALTPLTERINKIDGAVADLMIAQDTLAPRSELLALEAATGKVAADLREWVEALVETELDRRDTHNVEVENRRFAELRTDFDAEFRGVRTEASASERATRAALGEMLGEHIKQVDAALAAEASQRGAGDEQAREAAGRLAVTLDGLRLGLDAHIDGRLAASEQRSAEKLAGLVQAGLAALEADVAKLRGPPGEGFRYREVYDAQAEYAAGDWVTHDGTLWAALAPSKGLTPGSDAANASWRMAMKRARDGANGIGMNWRGNYIEGDTYRLNDVVRFMGRVLVCRRTTTAPPPIPGGAPASEWSLMLDLTQ